MFIGVYVDQAAARGGNARQLLCLPHDGRDKRRGRQVTPGLTVRDARHRRRISGETDVERNIQTLPTNLESFCVRVDGQMHIARGMYVGNYLYTKEVTDLLLHA